MSEMNSPFSAPATFTTSRLLRILAVSSFTCILLYFIISFSLLWADSNFRNFMVTTQRISLPTSCDHLVFGLASSTKAWAKHKEFLKLWWQPNKTRGCVFVDALPPEVINSTHPDRSAFPPICVSEDTSRFRYTHKHGYRNFIRVARIVSETVNLSRSGESDDIRWYVFGDGNTVFFPENLVKTLSKYNPELWYFIGSNSESYEQNKASSFDMAFWGAGFALSAPLARALAKVFDSCLERYPYLYSADERIYVCLAELGVPLTHERGFHQVDIRGNIFGLLVAHPLTPLVSLSHMDEVEPLFPQKTAIDSLHHLFKSVHTDSERTLQQIVCYDGWFSWTISISWGYAVEVFNRHIHLHDALRPQETFTPWKKGVAANYMFNTRPLHPDTCGRSTIFFLDQVHSKRMKVTSTYRRIIPENCTYDPITSPKKLEQIIVFSQKSNLEINQLRAPRRQCCDISPPKSIKKLEVLIRECRDDELIKIHL